MSGNAMHGLTSVGVEIIYGCEANTRVKGGRINHAGYDLGDVTSTNKAHVHLEFVLIESHRE